MEAGMSRTTTYEEILATMPEGIEATILAILRNHVGSENAITLQALTAQALGDCNTTTNAKPVKRLNTCGAKVWRCYPNQVNQAAGWQRIRLKKMPV